MKSVLVSPDGALLSSVARAQLGDMPSLAPAAQEASAAPPPLVDPPTPAPRPSAAAAPAAQDAPGAPLADPPTPVPRPSAAAAASAAPAKLQRERPEPPRPLASAPARQSLARLEPAPASAPPPPNVAPQPGASGGFSADAVLQFVPNLYDKAASALRGPQPAAPQPAPNPAPPPPAAASNNGGFSADAVLQFVPNLYKKATSALGGSPRETEVARADPGEASAYAVELAAPASEQAARREEARLRSRYASELGGRQPMVRETEMHGRKAYQLRVGGLSKADAAALCGRLRAGGEAGCSVARE